jgi:hypothetical protein
VDLSENGTENGKTAEDVRWDNCVPENFDIQGPSSKHASRGGDTISCFVETVVDVSVGGVDCDFVTSFLKSDGRVNHKSLGTA